jgi:hypothetical protein
VLEKKLYTIKVTGELRPLAFSKGGFFYGQQVEPGYRISVGGVKKRLTLNYLEKLTYKDVEVVDLFQQSKV